MSSTTGIEWTESTWNPIAGCSLMSPGCTNCYAMKMAHRLGLNPVHNMAEKYGGLTRVVKGKPVWTGKVRVIADQLLKPLRRRKPTVYFTNSMSDLFHPALDFSDVARIWAVMAIAGHHVFQVLTKRPDRMAAWLNNPGTPDAVAAAMRDISPKARLASWPLQNIWIGTSVEDQKRADERIPVLLSAPGAIRFLSMEPLLGPVSLRTALKGTALARKTLKQAGLDWIIVGGESGTGARPMHPAWARSLRDECVSAGVPFFFKQIGSWAWLPAKGVGKRSLKSIKALLPDGTEVKPGTQGAQLMRRGSKKTAGKTLDGKIWQQMPNRPGDPTLKRAA